jgi:TPR repeat protein
MAGGISRALIRVFAPAIIGGLWINFAQGTDLSATRMLPFASHSTAVPAKASKPPVVRRIFRPHIDLAEIDERYFGTVAAETLRPALVDSYKAYKAGRFQQALDVLKSVNQDDRHVLLMQGIAYLALSGSETFKTSLEKLERAATTEPRAALVLGILHLVRTAYTAPDEQRGRELIETAVANGDAVAMRALAEGYLAGWIGETDPARSIMLLKQAAAKGDAKASFRLAEHYFTGTGTTKDNAEAEAHLLKSAEAGYAEAQAFLGTWHFLDIAAGLSDDAASALGWLEKAAGANHPRALEYLGLFYAEIGKRLGQTDLPRAVGYFKRCVETSADQDCAFAYAQALENGIGVDQDKVAAIAMYSIANRDGLSIKALRRIDRIKDELSKQDLMRAVSIRDTTLKGVETLTGVTTNKSKQTADEAVRMRVTR